MIFKQYKNRFNHVCILEDGLLNKFLAMKDDLFASGVEIDMTEGWRGQVAQDQDVATGHSRASWGHSPHDFGVAFDVAPIINGTFVWPDDMTLWNQIGDTGKGQGLTWGGNFRSIVDLPHFELTDWNHMGLKLYSQAPMVTP